jgi:hypothetical protein
MEIMYALFFIEIMYALNNENKKNEAVRVRILQTSDSAPGLHLCRFLLKGTSDGIRFRASKQHPTVCPLSGLCA